MIARLARSKESQEARQFTLQDAKLNSLRYQMIKLGLVMRKWSLQCNLKRGQTAGPGHRCEWICGAVRKYLDRSLNDFLDQWLLHTRP